MVSIDQIANQITQVLRDYTNEVEQEIEVIKERVSKDAVSELKTTSPKLTGSYRKGWRVKKVGKKRIVHNKTDYQLTHLLEKGHANRNGGRTPAKVHIQPVEEKVFREFIDDVERAIRE
ncbi:hypothetical protein [Metabacillus indicus]|uniref:hypothetical protein n=1 Tax=Metabacillus indicus TaxID=246786 RepID=UPI0004935E9E|nr:hypothetical protein [Metabacillus indicus]KEZ51332.1 hypothetical protein AZ46_0212205 [Metabacillus indicus LMG 22858]